MNINTFHILLSSQNALFIFNIRVKLLPSNFLQIIPLLVGLNTYESSRYIDIFKVIEGNETRRGLRSPLRISAGSSYGNRKVINGSAARYYLK